MDENEALVGELRRYLSSAQPAPLSVESEQVQALKRDLQLAARVGQQLLMQLRHSEHERNEQNIEIEKLRVSNREIQRENHRLAAEHGALTDSLTEQEQQIATLVAQLATTQQQADKLARATASARALEREVELLEQSQADLRAELETRGDSLLADSIVAKKLAANVSSELERLKIESREGSVESSGSVSTKNSTKSSEERPQTSENTPNFEPPPRPQLDHSNISLMSVPSLSIGPDGTTFESEIRPTDAGTPKRTSARPHQASTPIKLPAKVLKSHTPAVADHTQDVYSSHTPVSNAYPMPRGSPIPASDISETRPKLGRARSHESVLSFVPSPPRMSAFMAPRMAAPSVDAPRIDAPEVRGATGSTDTTFKAPVPSKVPVRSAARDKLSQMRGGNVEIRKPERRWAFTPFKMQL